MPDAIDSESIRVPATFKWSHWGSNVEIAGSFDAPYSPWTPIQMVKVDGSSDFVVTLNLKPNTDYSYKFVVDGNWVLDNDVQSYPDSSGHHNHVISVQPPIKKCDIELKDNDDDKANEKIIKQDQEFIHETKEEEQDQLIVQSEVTSIEEQKIIDEVQTNEKNIKQDQETINETKEEQDQLFVQSEVTLVEEQKIVDEVQTNNIANEKIIKQDQETINETKEEQDQLFVQSEVTSVEGQKIVDEVQTNDIANEKIIKQDQETINETKEEQDQLFVQSEVTSVEEQKIVDEVQTNDIVQSEVTSIEEQKFIDEAQTYEKINEPHDVTIETVEENVTIASSNEEIIVNNDIIESVTGNDEFSSNAYADTTMEEIVDLSHDDHAENNFDNTKETSVNKSYEEQIEEAHVSKEIIIDNVLASKTHEDIEGIPTEFRDIVPEEVTKETKADVDTFSDKVVSLVEEQAKPDENIIIEKQEIKQEETVETNDAPLISVEEIDHLHRPIQEIIHDNSEIPLTSEVIGNLEAIQGNDLPLVIENQDTEIVQVVNKDELESEITIKDKSDEIVVLEEITHDNFEILPTSEEVVNLEATQGNDLLPAIENQDTEIVQVANKDKLESEITIKDKSNETVNNLFSTIVLEDSNIDISVTQEVHDAIDKSQNEPLMPELVKTYEYSTFTSDLTGTSVNLVNSVNDEELSEKKTENAYESILKETINDIANEKIIKQDQEIINETEKEQDQLIVQSEVTSIEEQKCIDEAQTYEKINEPHDVAIETVEENVTIASYNEEITVNNDIIESVTGNDEFSSNACADTTMEEIVDLSRDGHAENNFVHHSYLDMVDNTKEMSVNKSHEEQIEDVHVSKEITIDNVLDVKTQEITHDNFEILPTSEEVMNLEVIQENDLLPAIENQDTEIVQVANKDKLESEITIKDKSNETVNNLFSTIILEDSNIDISVTQEVHDTIDKSQNEPLMPELVKTYEYSTFTSDLTGTSVNLVNSVNDEELSEKKTENAYESILEETINEAIETAATHEISQAESFQHEEQIETDDSEIIEKGIVNETIDKTISMIETTFQDKQGPTDGQIEITNVETIGECVIKEAIEKINGDNELISSAKSVEKLESRYPVNDTISFGAPESSSTANINLFPSGISATTIYKASINSSKIPSKEIETYTTIEDQKKEEILKEPQTISNATNISQLTQRKIGTTSSGESTREITQAIVITSKPRLTGKVNEELIEVSTSKDVILTRNNKLLQQSNKSEKIEGGLCYLITTFITTFTLGIVSLLFKAVFWTKKND